LRDISTFSSESKFTKSFKVLAGTVNTPGTSTLARKLEVVANSKLVARNSTFCSVARINTLPKIGRFRFFPATPITKASAFDRFSFVQKNFIFETNYVTIKTS
jgi:hypothetical protein